VFSRAFWGRSFDVHLIPKNPRTFVWFFFWFFLCLFVFSNFSALTTLTLWGIYFWCQCQRRTTYSKSGHAMLLQGHIYRGQTNTKEDRRETLYLFVYYLLVIGYTVNTRARGECYNIAHKYSTFVYPFPKPLNGFHTRSKRKKIVALVLLLFVSLHFNTSTYHINFWFLNVTASQQQ
jgi:hypothetical protein